MYFQVAFYASGTNPENHSFVALDISAPRSSSGSSGSTSSTTSMCDKITEMPECLRSNDKDDDVFVPSPTFNRTHKEPPKKRPRNSSQDLFLNSSPESCSELVLTPFFGKPTPEMAILQIIGISVKLHGIGKRVLTFCCKFWRSFLASCYLLKLYLNENSLLRTNDLWWVILGSCHCSWKVENVVFVSFIVWWLHSSVNSFF